MFGALRAGFRAHRREDAVQHVPPLYGGRASDPRDRASRADRARRVRDEHPLANEIIHKVLSREVLYVAMLLHDIAKGREGDHSDGRRGSGAGAVSAAGAEAGGDRNGRLARAQSSGDERCRAEARSFGPQDDPRFRRRRAIAGAACGLLLCLTVADIRAVGPGVWNGWKGQLLRQLYYEAEAQMLGGFSATARPQLVAEAKAELAKRLADWPRSGARARLSRHYDAYWLALDAAAHEAQARQMREAEASGVTLTSDRARPTRSAR